MNTIPLAISARSRRLQSQRGVVLIIALIVLVAMTLAGISLVRSVDSATLISGNLAFRQSSALFADQGIAAGVTWLRANPTVLAVHQPPTYYASWDGGLASGVHVFDPSKFTWGASVVDTNSGNQYAFVIHRMCSATGPATTGGAGNCVAGFGSSDAPDRTIGPSNCVGKCPGAPVVLYRVTARAIGPRNTVAYTQAVVY